MYQLRPDQKTVKNQIIKSLKTDDRVLLGAVTGFGKTVVAWSAIEDMTRRKKRVLVLTHGQREIRTNFCTSVAKIRDFVEIKGKDDFDSASESRCVIAIPQTIKNHLAKLGKFDFVVTDEAHQFYEASGVQKILQELKQKNKNLKELLLTATHYRFKNIPKVLFSREKALELNLINNAGIQMLELPCKINPSDYTVSNELKSTVTLSKTPLKKFFDVVIDQISQTPMKSVVVAHNVETAEFIYKLLRRSFHSNMLTMSHSFNDPECNNIDEFKHDKNIKILVVVNRANLGFDCKNLRYLIDLTMSKNVERIEQMFGRILRKYGRVKKSYIKAFSKNNDLEYKIIMSGVLALSIDDIYESWDGSYKKLQIAIPEYHAHPKNPDDENDLSQGRLRLRNLHDFKEYISIFKNSDHVALNEAIKKAKNIKRTSWLTYDGCIATAKKYDSIQKWQSSHSGSYTMAFRNNWHRQIANELGWDVLRSKYTYDEIKNIAKQYSSLAEWGKKHTGSYGAAYRRQWQQKIADELGWKIRTQKYTYDDIKRIAMQYSSISDWRKNHCGSYSVAKLNKWQRKIASDLGWSVLTSKYTYDDIKRIAMQYSSISDWRKNHCGSYSVAKLNKWQRKIASDLGWSVLTSKYTYDDIKRIAMQYSSISDWRKNHNGSYGASVRNKWQQQIAKEFGWKIAARYTYENCKKEAANYKSLAQWSSCDLGSYSASLRNKWQRKIADELGWKVRNIYHNYEQIKKIAEQFSKISEWQRYHSGSYKAAVRNKWRQQIIDELGWKVKGA